MKFEHTLFALPFAYVGMFLAADGWPGLRAFALITLAMVGARTLAMALNRVIDATIDARNPRTANREIPSGRLTRTQGLAIAGAGLIMLVGAGISLNRLTALLLPVAVAFFVAYPYMKRLTWLCHVWLGITIGAAGAGGYIAVTGTFTSAAWLLWIAVAAWIAGFDILYALLDREVDVAQGIRSIPARFGVGVARYASAGLYLVAITALLALYVTSNLSWVYAAWVLFTIVPLLAWQHRLVARRGVKVALAAFNANLWVSSLVLAAVVTDVLIR